MNTYLTRRKLFNTIKAKVNERRDAQKSKSSDRNGPAELKLQKKGKAIFKMLAVVDQSKLMALFSLCPPVSNPIFFFFSFPEREVNMIA